MDWAEDLGAEIVSCDPLLFYRGMDIGTAKPTPAQLSRVRHHLIDIAEVDQPMDIRAFVERAEETVAEIHSRSRRVLVCGASGFYLQAFFRPVVDLVTVSPELRKEVGGRLDTDGLDALVEELRSLNPQGLGELDIRNPRRVVRALERCLSSGLDMATLRAEMEAQSNTLIRARKVTVRLARDKDDLNRRITARVNAMLEDGLVAEVEGLLKRGLERNPSAASAVGYRETIEWLRHPSAPETLAGAISGNTRRLVRKQMSWFRNQLPDHRVIDLQEGGVDASSLLASVVSGRGGSMEMP
jgi:tRNA dimethylallyltransferase